MQIADRLYLETDNACGLCGHRNPYHLTIHHIDGNHENNAYENQIIICHNCHQSHHDGRGLGVEQINEQKRRLILKTITPYGLTAMKLTERKKIGVPALPFLLYHLVDLGYMEEVRRLMAYTHNDSEVSTLALFRITERGSMILRLIERTTT